MELETLRKELEQDKLTHVDMIDCIDRGFAQIVKMDSRGVLLYNTGCDVYHLTAREPAFVQEALEECRKGTILVCHQDFLVEEIGQKLGLQPLEFYHGVYTKPQMPPARGEEPEIRQLDIGWLDALNPYYYDGSEENVLRTALERGEMLGAFIDGKLAGFIGCHQEGTYGILSVVPEFRRRGVGYALERHIIGFGLEQGRIPYCQVRPDNKASLSLQNKLGLELSPHTVYWFF